MLHVPFLTSGVVLSYFQAFSLFVITEKRGTSQRNTTITIHFLIALLARHPDGGDMKKSGI